MDAFDRLGVPARFDLSPDQIRRAWLAAAARLHPDRAGAEDQEAASAIAALNAAKAVVEDPERRADALLVRLGGPAREQDKTLPPGFLADILSVREEMEEALASGDPGRSAAAEAMACERREGHIAAVGQMFERLGAAPSAEALQAIRVELNAWRYAERMIEQLRSGGGSAGL
ncbi:MAG: DnaJ domain-containing protein [Phycisphaerales bacterium]|nr:DnaJ domain-containing protein [Phycisphaerales bacterium]